MTAGSLISLPKQYFLEKPEIVYDNYDRYTLIAFKDDKARKTLLGAIYMRPALMKSGLEAISKQFCEIELAIEQLLSQKGWSAEECEIILGGDFNTNIDGEKNKDLTSICKKTQRD